MQELKRFEAEVHPEVNLGPVEGSCLMDWTKREFEGSTDAGLARLAHAGAAVVLEDHIGKGGTAHHPAATTSTAGFNVRIRQSEAQLA
jgi:hypothetical protein